MKNAKDGARAGSHGKGTGAQGCWAEFRPRETPAR